MKLTPFVFVTAITAAFLTDCPAQQRSIDFRGEYESWNSGISNSSNALLLGLGGYYQYDQKWSMSGGFVTGDYSLSEKNTTLSRTDMDLAVGYRWQPEVTAFAGYRILRIKYNNKDFDSRSFTDLTHGFGIGANIIHSLRQQWFGYTRMMGSLLLSNLKLKGKDVDRGIGLSLGAEGGAIYQYNEKTSFGIGLKYQKNIVDYKNDSNPWNHDYLRLGFSISRSI